jgi:integrase
LTVDSKGRAGLAPATVQVVYRVVASVFRAAVNDRRIALSPCQGIRLPEVVKARVRPMTMAQVDVLAAQMPRELQALVTLTAGTGLRQGEALGVTRDRLRLLGKNPAVTVDRQLVTAQGGDTAFGPLKTKASYRTIPLPHVVVQALNTHIAEHEIDATGLLFTLDGNGHHAAEVRARVEARGACSGPRGRDRQGHACAAALLRESVDPVRRVREDSSEPARSQVRD